MLAEVYRVGGKENNWPKMAAARKELLQRDHAESLASEEVADADSQLAGGSHSQRSRQASQGHTEHGAQSTSSPNLQQPSGLEPSPASAIAEGSQPGISNASLRDPLSDELQRDKLKAYEELMDEETRTTWLRMAECLHALVRSDKVSLKLQASGQLTDIMMHK